jgi:hypothetical protein
MSRNGSGTYTLPAGNPVVTGTTISSTWANSTLTNIASALTDSLAADGQTTATGNLKMGNNRITGLADGLASTDAATVGQLPSSALFLLKASNLSDVANATTARGNLTAAKSGANSDITSITGLTTPLTVAQGGTGAATLTANNVLLGNGTSAPQFVAPSTAGNVLTSNGTTWASSAPNSGKVLQVLQTVKTDTFTMSSTTFADITGLSVSITPSNSANKILVFAHVNNVGTVSTSSSGIRLVRNSTEISVGDAAGSRVQVSGGSNYGVFGVTITGDSVMFLDSPATTSATTYKIQIQAYASTAYVNRSPVDSNDPAYYRTVSSITVMEIAA